MRRLTISVLLFFALFSARALLFAQDSIPGDINVDGTVDKTDLFLVSKDFGKKGQIDTDINKDGITDRADLMLVKNNFGKCMPVAGDITPSSGSSKPQEPVLFTTTYRDANGWQDIKHVHLLIKDPTDPQNCFFGYYDPRANKLYLRDDANNTWLGGFAPKSNNIIANSYVTLKCSKTIVPPPKGDTLTVNWNIIFNESFAGNKKTYLFARDFSDLETGWVEKGTWLVKSNDKTPPTGTIKIENDKKYANSTAVTLALSAQDNSGRIWQMQFSNDNRNWSAAEPYFATKEWVLTSGDGTKTVYAKFIDANGNPSQVYSDTIILDTKPPTLEITSPKEGEVIK